MSEEAKMEVRVDPPAGSETPAELKEILEALLFASDEPVTFETLRAVFDDMNRDNPDGEKINPTKEEIRGAVDSLNGEYVESRRAYKIQQLAGGFVFATDKKFASWVGKLFKEKARRKLSQTAVETLAIIAYKQPITKSEIEFIRGVNADYIMKTLLEKNLTTIVGRAHSPGRPLLYGTTPEFLKHFGLNEITDLPKPREIEELLGETELEVEKRMLASQEELEFKEKLQEKLDPNSRAPHIPRKKSRLQEPGQEGEGKTVVEKITPIIPLTHKEEKAAEPALAKEVTVLQPPADQPAGIAPELVEISGSETAGAAAGDAAATNPETADVAEPVQFVMPPQEPILEREVTVAEPVEPSSEQEVPENVLSGAAFPAETPAEETQTEKHESKKGWSTWKTKIQTFFRRLFG